MALNKMYRTFTYNDMINAYRAGKTNKSDVIEASKFEGGDAAYKANIPATEWIKTYKSDNQESEEKADRGDAWANQQPFIKIEDFSPVVEEMENEKYYVSIPSMKGMGESGKTLQDALYELMLSLEVKFAYEHNIPLSDKRLKQDVSPVGGYSREDMITFAMIFCDKDERTLDSALSQYKPTKNKQS